VIGAYRHLECHKSGCHRLGRFTHGHYKLCHLHYPGVPNDGKVTREQIEAVGVTQAQRPHAVVASSTEP